MNRREKNMTVGKIHSLIESGFKRIEQLEEMGEYGLPHTAVREQINGLAELVNFYRSNYTKPFVWHDWQETVDLLGEKKKTHSWLGWL